MDAEQYDFEHGRGHHIAIPETDCARCAAGELPTVAELMHAVVERDARDASWPAWYRQALAEWLQFDRELSTLRQIASRVCE